MALRQLSPAAAFVPLLNSPTVLGSAHNRLGLGAHWLAMLGIVALVVAIGVIAHRLLRRSDRAAKLARDDELSAIKARLTEAQRIAGIGNWVLDTQTNQLWWSDEIFRLFDIDRGEFDANYETFLDRVHADDRRAVDAAVMRAVKRQEPYSIDHRIVHRDGSIRVMHERAEILRDDDGQPIRLAGTVHDVTDRKAAEEKLRQQAEFQALLARLSTSLFRSQPADLDAKLREALDAVGRRYELDALSIWWLTDDQQSLHTVHRWVRPGNEYRNPDIHRSAVPWISSKILAGEPAAIGDVDVMPDEAAADREQLLARGVKALLVVPLQVDDTLEGSCTFGSYDRAIDWCKDTVAELTLIAESLAGAIVRNRAFAEIEALKNQLQAENVYLREEVRLAQRLDQIVGQDPALKKSLQAVQKVAPTDMPVLVVGETGTGKEVIAHAIHDLSDRSDGPMVSVNCAAMPANIVESELFGHEQGAFPGANVRRRGRIELADGGTLFLDEIAVVPRELQTKLLHFLRTGEFSRLGDSEVRRADVRLVAATDHDLDEVMNREEILAGLYEQIGKLPIRLPPLRERQGDIRLLAEHFVLKHASRLGKRVAAISTQMLRELAQYNWPGNVRELESIIERALISSGDSTVLELPTPLGAVTDTQPGLQVEAGTDLHAAERAHIVNTLEKTGWKISGADGAAAALGIPSSTLRSKMKRLGIERKKP